MDEAEVLQKYAPQFEMGRQRRETPEGASDMSGISAMFGGCAARLKDTVATANEEYFANKLGRITDLLTTTFCCAHLRPGDLSREVFEALPGFQSLLLQCQPEAVNVSPRVEVVHQKDADALLKDREGVEQAVVVLRIYPLSGFTDGFLSISADDATGLPLQNWPARLLHVTQAEKPRDMKVMRPLKLKI